MNDNLTIQNLLPTVTNQALVQDKLRNSTFIGIDFGTSTTVVSYAIMGDDATPIKTDTIPIRQQNRDGSFVEDHLVPTCIAWHDNQLFIGQTAKLLKSRLQKGRNLWFSFKMELGEDNGPVYTSSQYDGIENPLDAAKVFLSYIKKEIDAFISKNNLPPISYYSVSIPASFEANQRKDLKEALTHAGIPIQDSLFIDEPNAAFLSYLVQANSNNFQNFNIPLDSPLHILVFDFGAGTCDISILEIGRKANKLYSKNIAISKYEQLGGDDIDKQIVKDVLYPQLLKQNNLEPEDIRSAEYEKGILPKLQTIAEVLKVKICKEVASNMIGRALPSLATSEERAKITQSIPDFVLPKHRLSYTEPSLSFKEFSKVMESFTKKNIEKSIFSVIESALQKANLDKEYLDLVLLIGGSSNNPYIQKALRDYFGDVEIEIPRDLQSHVSTGAGINSFLQNGMGIDMISPIVSEPILIILQNEELRILVKEGTEIPCKGITIDNLHPQRNGQQEIEIPICVSNKDKILTFVKIQSEEGFDITDTIRLECEITHDKLVHFKAFIKDIQIVVEPVNPFANRSLTTEEIAEKRLLKAINQAARKNGGRPPIHLMDNLVEFYKQIKNYQKVAETYETIQTLDPKRHHETTICYYYSKAGNEKLSDKWAEEAYKNDPNPVSAYNLALIKKYDNPTEFERLMEEAIRGGLDSAFLVYGKYLRSKDEKRANELLQKAFDIWYKRFKNNCLREDDYSRLIEVSELLDRDEIAQKVRKAKDAMKDNEQVSWFDPNNLVTDKTNNLKLPNNNLELPF
jgi:chaperone dnaK